MRKLLTILLTFIVCSSMAQTGETKPVTAKVLQTPNNATFHFNQNDTTVGINMGTYGYMKLAGAKKFQYKLDSLAAHITVNDSLAHSYVFSGRQAITGETSSVTWPEAFADTSYHLEYSAYYYDESYGKVYRMNHAVYDPVKTASGFSFKVDTVAGYYEYTAYDLDSIGIGIAGPSGTITEVDPTVPSWAKEPEPPIYTYGDVGAEPANANIQNHISSSLNPHSVTKSQVGLSNADNTSDLSKPISTATQTTLDGKQASLISGVNIKSINSISLLGSGNIDIIGEGGGITTELDPVFVAWDKDYADLINQPTIPTLTSQITASTDRKYVTDAEKIVIGNTSGTNTGDETTATIKTKLSITTLSGSNTGDQTLPTLASLGAVATTDSRLAPLAYPNILASDNTWYGETITGTAGESLVLGDFVYFKFSDLKWWKASASAYATARCKGISTATIAANGTGLIFLKGIIRHDAWNWTASEVWLSTTAGAGTSTQPSATGNQIQFIGTALSADLLFFNPSNDIGEK